MKWRLSRSNAASDAGKGEPVAQVDRGQGVEAQVAERPAGIDVAWAGVAEDGGDLGADMLGEGRTALDAVTACFPAGTLSGAPKVRAMELIEEVEKTRRGLYGGVVGYLDFAGNADFAIAIRTALMRDGTAYVQAGGGVVADSNGPYEFTEATNKARAVLNAIAAAETLVGARDDPCA